MRGARFILLAGTAVLATILLYRLCRANVYCSFAVSLFAGGLVLGIIVDRGVSKEKRKSLRLRSIAPVAVLIAGLVAWVPLPLTGVSLRIHQVYESTEFAIRRTRPAEDAAFVSLYRARGGRNTDLNFILETAVDRSDTVLRFYPGQRPRRLYYGRHFFPCDIQRLSFGTDVFFVYIPLVRFEGRDMLPMMTASENGSLKDIDGHTLRAWGPVSIKADAGRIRAETPGLRVLMVKSFWLLLLMAAFWLGLSLPAPPARVNGWRRRAERFLAR